MRLARVFPRRTNATPDDDLAFVGEPTLWARDIDKVDISVTFLEDKPIAEGLAEAWRYIAPVEIGGPAYDDPGGEFYPGKYLKHGYVITSRGCPNHCWFCMVPKREGTIRELEIKDGYNVLDSNLLACSKKHIESVFQMLARQPHQARFTGGLESARMTNWIAEMLKELRPKIVFFAYDEPGDEEPLREACKILRAYDILPDRGHGYRCYVLCGYRDDTLEDAERRMIEVCKLGVMPMAMLYDKEYHRDENDGWIQFQRHWARPPIIAHAMKSVHPQDT